MKTRTYLFFIILLPLLLICCKKNSECESGLEQEQKILTTCEGQDSIKYHNCNNSNICEIFFIIEQMPVISSCDSLNISLSAKRQCTDEEIQNFLNENIIYPSCAIENKIEGEVIVEFVILRTGCLSRIKVIRDIGYGCGEEIQRAISTMPDWIPGRQRGVLTDVLFRVPYEFKL